MNGAPRSRFISWCACWSFALLTTQVTENKRLAVKLAVIGKQDAGSFVALSFVNHQSWHFQCESMCKNGHFKLRLCKLPTCLTEAMQFSLWRFIKVIFSDYYQVGWKFYGSRLFTKISFFEDSKMSGVPFFLDSLVLRVHKNKKQLKNFFWSSQFEKVK